MTKEIIFNFFLICNSGLITKIGYVAHEIEGTDDEKTTFLLSNAYKDSKNIVFFDMPKNSKIITPLFELTGALRLDFYEKLSFNQITSLFESVFIEYNALSNPLYVSTLIVDGELNMNK